MNPHPPSGREEDLFHRALALPAAERAAFLDRECRGQSALRAAVESLVQHHLAAPSFLQTPAPGVAETVASFAPPLEEGPGQTIGRYKLLEKIGEGGFGIVYMAAQEEPVRRRVALKVIKLGMDTREVVARFEAERQALALMDHPNIAKVFDGGATDHGRPYFAMELVKGVPITTYCDQRQLSTPARLELFILVCQAVQHAHQKGVIHRDLKPSNILVTELDDRPVPKVIDFGVARATQSRLTEKTMFTQFHQMIGTPAYMSPEQTGLANLDIDTRSDIYSLGVLLYELLTGCTPFDAKKLLEAGYEGIMRMIREEEPPKPSTRLSSLSVQELSALGGRRQEEPRRLGRRVQGDLDWIVMKALEKDRTRRYETATSLAQDLQRHLGNEPVVARPASHLYRFRKLIRRHRLACAAASAVLVLWAAGTIVSTYLAVRAVRAEKRADLDNEVASNVSRFLSNEIFEPIAERPGLTLTQLLDLAVPRIEQNYRSDGSIRRELYSLTGHAYLLTDDFAKAVPLLQKAVVARRALVDELTDRKIEDDLTALARAHRGARQFPEAIAVTEDILRRQEAVARGPWDRVVLAQTRADLGEIYLAAGQKEKGAALVEKLLAEVRTVTADRSDKSMEAEAMERVASAWLEVDRVPEAIALLEGALALKRAHPAARSPWAFATMDRLGVVYSDHGRVADAITLLTESLALRRAHRDLGPAHPATLATLASLAAACEKNHDPARAEMLRRERLALLEQLHRSDASAHSPLHKPTTAP